MKGKSVVTVTVVSFLVSLLFIAGFGWAVLHHYTQNALSKPPQIPASQQESEKHQLVVLAIGDSLTRGTGDQSGKGYVGDLVDLLEQRQHMPVIARNFGIKGQTSTQLLDLIGQKEIQRQIKEADVIVMTIGGNDLFLHGQSLLDLNEQHIRGIEQSYQKNLSKILSELRFLNSQAVIYPIGLYNPFGNTPQAQLTSKIVRDWNHLEAEVSSKCSNTVFVPIFDLFELHVEQYLYSDQFHPNEKGYERIAERIAPLISQQS